MPPVLLVPGGTQACGDTFPGLADGLRADPGCRVGCVDGGGSTFGGSGAHLARAVRSLGDGPAVVVGHSLGGAAAVLLAAEQPQLVAGLVLLDPSPVPDVRACARIEGSLRLLAATARRSGPDGDAARLATAVRGLTAAARRIGRSPLPRVPAVLVGSGRDPSSDVARGQHRLAAALGIEVDTWPGTPHHLHETEPDRVLATVRTLLAHLAHP